MKAMLEAKIEARNRGLENLTQSNNQRRISHSKLIEQMGAHEIAMRDSTSVGTPRWLKWAESRLAGMQIQRQETETLIETTDRSIARLRSEVDDFTSQLEEITSEEQRQLQSTIAKTMAAVDGRKVGKNPNRKYYGVGEHPNFGKKRSQQTKPDKKNKPTKGQKSRKGKGQQRAA